jgi:hypothetical protein
MLGLRLCYGAWRFSKAARNVSMAKLVRIGHIFSGPAFKYCSAKHFLLI